MKIVLDTNVFNDKKFLSWLKEKDIKPVTSAVVYMEILYKYAKRTKDIEIARSVVQTVFRELGIEIYDFTPELVEIAVKSAVGRWDFKENARDCMIGALAVKHNAPMITHNKKHFEWYEKVFTPEEFMELTK